MNDSEGSSGRVPARLQADYTLRLRTRLEEIEVLWAELVIEGWSLEHAGRIREQCHALAGSAGTFGHGRAARIARLAEERFVAALEAGNVRPAHFEQLREVVEALLAVLDSTAAGGEASDPDPAGPAAPAPVAAPEPDPMAEPLPSAPVYVVEDDEALAEHIVEQLSLHGHDAHAFGHPAALLRAVRDGAAAPMAIVADIIFPKAPRAGIEMARQLRAKYGVEAPVLFVSRDDSFQTRLDIIRAGGNAFFVKPLDISALVERMDQIAGRNAEEALRVLVIDDDDVFGDLTCAVLEAAGIEARALTRPTEAIEIILDYRPDLVLLDVHMPEVNGMELAQVLRQHESCRDLPILFLSAETDPERQAAALDIGVDGFLTKPVDHAYLIAAVANRAERARALRRKVHRDSLTHLLVHDEIRNQLVNQLATARRYGRPLSYAMIDVDFFKRINDSYGHATGDHVLKNMAALLRRSFRRGDVLGRYGGEEFVIILQDTGLDDAVLVIERLREEFGALRHRAESGEEEFSVTFSAGVSAYPEFETATDIQNKADHALYRAKERGRNRVERAERIWPPEGSAEP